MGHMVLINSVMDSQLTYIVSVLLLPQGTIDALNRRQRSFLWSGNNNVSGAQCLIAWELACQPKAQGGLGIKDLVTSNKSFLLKLLHRLNYPEDSSRARWVRSHIDLVTLHGDIVGMHGKELEGLLPLYHAITICEVFDGVSTSFWLDRWLFAGRLCELFPLLHMHATRGDVLVAQVIEEGLNRHLVP